jgi:hypothetical protein
MKLRTKAISTLAYCLISTLLFSCKFDNPMDDLTIGIDLNIFKTYVSFKFADAATGELIGKTDGVSVNLVITGEDALAVVSQTGERPDHFGSVLGMISVALNPYDPFKISADNPVNFAFEASAPGYLTSSSSLSLSETGTHTCLVTLQRVGTNTSGSQSFTVLPGKVDNGILSSGFRLITPGNQFELQFPDSLHLSTSTGEPVNGNLIVEAISHPDLSTAIAATRVMQFFSNGTVTSALFQPVSIFEINLHTNSEADVTRVTGSPVIWRFQLPAETAAPDSIALWYWNPDIKTWESAGFAYSDVGGTGRGYHCALSHFSVYATGDPEATRPVSGSLSFVFEKAFFNPSFESEVQVRTEGTSNLLQTIPITVFSGLSVPLTLNLPLESAVTVSVVCHGDNAFRSTPANLTIQPTDNTFTHQFSLYPTNCRLSGSVTGNFLPGTVAYPVPATLTVRSAENGSTYGSYVVSVTEAGFSQAINQVVPENHAVRLDLQPRDLTKDFIANPAGITISNPCSDTGPWSFSLDANTCLINTTVQLILEGKIPPEPVPVILSLRRESDGKILTEKVVNLSSGTTTLPLELPVPRNTPLQLTIRAAYADRPVSILPASIRWANPCTEANQAEFRISPQYAHYRQSLSFTFDPALTHTEVPINLLAFKKSNDQQLFSIPLTVTRSQNTFDISRYTPAEPIVIKVTRANPAIRFNPDPYKLDILDPSLSLSPFAFRLLPTVLAPVHFLVKVVCPGGEVLPTVQGYYRIPGEEWREMNIISGHLNLNLEIGLTYEVGMILGTVMIDSTFTVTQPENNLTFPLDPADCKRMGWGEVR